MVTSESVRELCNVMVDTFWMRWMDCIHKLSPRPKNQHMAENLEVGDIVLVIGEDKKRGSWRMAEITQVFQGKDDLVRISSSSNTGTKAICKETRY